jgi:hypothetical protein
MTNEYRLPRWSVEPSEIREELIAARREGKTFGAAWAVLTCSGRLSPKDAEVLRATRGAWRDAYERRPAESKTARLLELAS